VDLVDSIRIFKSVGETKSFSKTAKFLGVSQPTVSKAICSLEERLGTLLLRRSTKGVSLTSEGERLLTTGRMLLDHVEYMIADLRAESVKLEGQLRISCSPAFARLVLTPLLNKFRESQPNLRTNFILSDSFIDPIENNLDVSIRVGEIGDRSLLKVRVGTVTRTLFGSKKYLKQYGEPETLEDLKEHRLLHYSRFTDPPSWFIRENSLSSNQFYFEPYFQTDSSDILREATINGVGLALLPTWMVQESQNDHDLKILLPDIVVSTAPIYALASKANQLSARQQTFIEFISEQFQKIPELADSDGSP